MIVSKPKTATLFSISIFLCIAFGLFAWGLYELTSTESKMGWYILVYTSGPIGLIVLIKILTGIKIVSIKKEKFEFNMPFRFKKTRFESRDIEKWSHTTIKTYGGQYEEVIWKLKSGQQLGLSKQENTEFDKVLRYMKKKLKKLQA